MNYPRSNLSRKHPTVLIVGRDGNISHPMVPTGHRLLELLIERQLNR